MRDDADDLREVLVRAIAVEFVEELMYGHLRNQPTVR
jgi:hypothetical protein